MQQKANLKHLEGGPRRKNVFGDHLILLFSHVARELKACRDPKTRNELLVQMRLIVEEADSLRGLPKR